MKKQLIATLVAALIIFFWQFLSWGLLSIHADQYGYTANEDRIMDLLKESNLEKGTYFIPGPSPDASEAEYQEKMNGHTGKPWAQIHYHPSWNLNMGMNLIRGMAADLVAAFLLVWVLLRFAKLDFSSALIASLAVGTIAYLTIPYLNSIWFEGTTMAYLLDTAVQWGAVGAWLGWYLPEKRG